MIPDILGASYEQATLALPDDFEGPVVATLVRKQATNAHVPSRRAVLYVHGYVDYFFQTELAERFTALGFNFYAIDLRKYGRSMRPHQTTNFCVAISDYFPDLDAAIDVILTQDGNTELLLVGHSTGGLLVPLYAHHRRMSLPLIGVILNSPFFEVNASAFTKRVLGPIVRLVGRFAPRYALPSRVIPFYGQSLHADQKGEWRYQLDWKPLNGIPLYAGWLRAVLRAQQELHRGLDIPCPVLVMSSTKSSWPKEWTDTVTTTDIVLDVDDIARYAESMGNHVTRIRIANGIHDLVLSPKPVRERVYYEIATWLNAYCPPIG